MCDSPSSLPSSPGKDSLHKAGEETSSALEFMFPLLWAWPNYPRAMSSTHKLISHDSQYNNSCCNSWYDSQCCASRIHHLKFEENYEGLIGLQGVSQASLVQRAESTHFSATNVPAQKCGGFPVCRDPRCLL